MHVSSISGSVGTDFLEACVKWSTVLPEFYGHLGNDTPVAVRVFSETRSQKGPNQADREDRRPHPCFWLSKMSALIKKAVLGSTLSW